MLEAASCGPRFTISLKRSHLTARARETAPEVFTRCVKEHSNITITAAEFYAHETNCEHV
jgi:hypothetical protein